MAYTGYTFILNKKEKYNFGGTQPDSETIPKVPTQQQITTRSGRVIRKPSYLSDFSTWILGFQRFLDINDFFMCLVQKSVLENFIVVSISFDNYALMIFHSIYSS